MTRSPAALSTIPVLGGYGQAASAFDRATDRLYQFGDGFLAIFDGTSGALLDATVPKYFSTAAPGLYNPVVTRAGEIIGLFSAPPTELQTTRIDPVTGILTIMAPFDGSSGQGMRTYDPCTDRMYQFGSQMFIVDGTTGQHLATVALSGVVSNVEAVY